MVPQLQMKQKIPAVTSKLSITILSIWKITAVIAVIFSDTPMRLQEDFSSVPVKNLTQCAMPQMDPVESSFFMLKSHEELVRTFSDIGVSICGFPCVAEMG